jgi:hypothetical protein
MANQRRARPAHAPASAASPKETGHETLRRHDHAHPARPFRPALLAQARPGGARRTRPQRPAQHALSHNFQEPDMAKGQKKSNKEARKPKQPKAKPPEVISVLNPAHKKR